MIPEEFKTSVEIISLALYRYFIPVDKIGKHIRDIRKDGYEMLRKVDHKRAFFPELKQQLPDIDVV